MQSEKLGAVPGAGTPDEMANEEPLTGWQAIADHFGQSVSWAQRAARDGIGGARQAGRRLDRHLDVNRGQALPPALVGGLAGEQHGEVGR